LSGVVFGVVRMECCMLKMMSVNALTDGQSMLSLYVGTLSRVDVDDKSKEDDRLLPAV
jgi:hypothetical protein